MPDTRCAAVYRLVVMGVRKARRTIRTRTAVQMGVGTTLRRRRQRSQPKPPNELKAPEAWRDPWDNPLPNPYVTDDLKGQTLLTQRDPEFAKWLKKYAESPYEAACEWQDQQAQS